MRLPDSLQSRLVLSHMLVAVVTVFFISVFAGGSIFKAAREDIGHSLETLAFATSRALEGPFQNYNEGRGDLSAVQKELMRLLANHPELQYTVYQPDGLPILNSRGTLPLKADPNTAPEVWAAIHGEDGQRDQVRLDSQGQQMLYVAVPVQREKSVYAILRLGTPLAPALDSARRSLALLLAVAILVTIAASLFAWLLANNLARPIQHLTQTAETLSQGDLGARATPSGTQELQRLAHTFNIMAGRLQDHVDELRAFIANASHELRTPLTVVKLRAEALRNGALEEKTVAEQFIADIESEVDRLVQMVNDLLDLSRMEAGLASNQRNLLNLGMVATDVYETFSIRAAKAGVSLNIEIEPVLPLMVGNEDQLRRVLYNFVDNAIKYTPRGGKVDLIIGAGNQGKSIRLVVSDTGPGISAEHLPHIFERFYRVEATRPRYGSSKGSGLGLAIAKTIIENHGGKIGVSSQLGKGATFWAELPTHVR